MTNPILTRIKASSVSPTPKAGNVWKDMRFDRKLGLGMGAVSLGLGIKNYNDNSSQREANEQRAKLEAKSLAALNKIHKAITTKE